MKDTQEKIRKLKEARGKEFSKGKKYRNNELINRCHTGINQLKAKL